MEWGRIVRQAKRLRQLRDTRPVNAACGNNALAVQGWLSAWLSINAPNVRQIDWT
jgi:hypothetical protein